MRDIETETLGSNNRSAHISRAAFSVVKCSPGEPRARSYLDMSVSEGNKFKSAASSVTSGTGVFILFPTVESR